MASFFKTSSLIGIPSPNSTSNLSSKGCGGALGAAPSGTLACGLLDAAASFGSSASATSSSRATSWPAKLGEYPESSSGKGSAGRAVETGVNLSAGTKLRGLSCSSYWGTYSTTREAQILALRGTLSLHLLMFSGAIRYGTFSRGSQTNI